MSQAAPVGSADQAQVLAQVRQQGASNEVYFVDSSLDAEALSLTVGDDSRVFVIENTSNAFIQMEQALQSLENPATAVHIYAHGAAGSVTLGGQVFDEAALNANAATLAAMGAALAEGADLLLYSCNTAAGSTGESFINRLARLASVDVAASDDVTGTSGDWTLEYTVGDVTTKPTNPGFDDDLDGGASWGVINGTTGADALTGSVTNDQFYGNGGKDLLVGKDGNDVYYISGDSTAGTQVVEAAYGGSDTVYSQVSDLNLSTSSTTAADTTSGNSQVEYIVLQAQTGMQNQSATGNNYSQTLVGNALNNQLTGMGGNDMLVAGDGNDYLDGGAGADALHGGAGNDILRYDPDDVLADGGKGIDFLVGKSAPGDLDSLFAAGKIKNIDALITDHGGTATDDTASLTSMTALEHVGITVQDTDGKATIVLDSSWKAVEGEGHTFVNIAADLHISVAHSASVSEDTVNHAIQIITSDSGG